MNKNRVIIDLHRHFLNAENRSKNYFIKNIQI